MKIAGGWLWRQVAVCMAISMAAPWAEAIAPPSAPSPQLQTAQAAQPQSSTPPAGASGAKDSTPAPAPSSPTAQNAQSQEGNGQAPEPADSQNSEQNRAPVGTAVAPATKTTGVAASSPAGAAIAPAKQKRAHTFLIRMGLLIGAGVAVGTVVALSSGSSSRPH